MELVNITYAGEGVQPVELSPQDQSLVTSNFINTQFGEANDYLELYIYDQNGQLIDFDYDAFDYYPYLTSNPKNDTYSTLVLDPEKDLKNRGFNRGNLNAQYNFYKRLFNSRFGTFYWIKEISTSRTELKLASQALSNTDIRTGFSQYEGYISNKNYYPVFYLNFGNNTLVTANNVAYTEDDQGGYLLVKLYEPLPTEFDIKSQLWIVDKIAESVSFDVSITVEVENVDQVNRLRGPNYNVVLNNKNGQTTPYYNYNNLLTSDVTSSYQKLLSYYQDRSVAINVDYSDFSNFIHFSSAVERVNNFVYKLELIESKYAEINEQGTIVGGSNSQNITSQSISIVQKSINNIIEKFDPYEYFLYFNSSSFAWPKRTATQPYQLYSVTSSQASNFLGGVDIVPTTTTASLLFSASYYDSTNKDLLHNSIPQYLLDDSSNQPFITFMDMVGQHFDNIWIYYKDLSNRYDATNNPDTGISLDVVGDALRGLGIQLYTNSNVSDNLYYTLFGINPDGSLLPPTGSEKITAIGGKYVTSSLATLSAKDIQQELYKRLYHNLPYLLKSKGTERGVKALISTFGIPDDILTVREFGGNPITSLDGILDLDTSDYKIIIATGSNGNVTSSLTLSSSLLSPYTSIQYYQNDRRVNSTNIEVGFSPADTINTNITASLGYFSIDQLIGAPGYQYSSSYTPLVSASNAYFSTYTQPNSIWEYIRLIKFYNNSLFKMIKDYVPARANLSTGIIVKSHMLERNKYARHEPEVTFNDYSQSIDMISISGSDGGSIIGSTSYVKSIMTISGSVQVDSTTGIEAYTGELSGSEMGITNGNAFPQIEVSSLPSSSLFIETPLQALYQNVTSSVRSLYLWDVDYSSQQTKPVNYNVITKSINEYQVNNYADYTNPNSPYAYVQDYNYFLNRSILPRYSGSQTISATYTTYTAGDLSYGKTAAIDKEKYQYAYLLDIYTSSIYFPNRSNAQIKYLIDNDQNVLDLTKANNNIFTVQNVFKSGETTDISLFQYDELNPYSQLLANNPTLQIFEGGFRYLPILHNLGGSSTMVQSFALTNPDLITITVTSGSTGGPSQDSNELQIPNWTIRWYSIETPYDETTSRYDIYLEVNYAPAFAPVTFNVNVNIKTGMQPDGSCTADIRDLYAIVNTGQSAGSAPVATIFTSPSGIPGGGTSYGVGSSHWPFGIGDCTNYIQGITQFGSGGGSSTGGSSQSTIYISTVTGSQPCLYYISQSSQFVFDSPIAYYYTRNGITYNSISDTSFANSSLNRVILPFTLDVGDRISVYDGVSGLGWDERFEYSVKNIAITGSGINGSRLLVETDRPVNLSILSTGSFSDSLTGARWRGCRYIVWKHIPDETNVILRYNPKDTTIVENGILFPQYIQQNVKENAGNTIKALKQQNLIDPDTNTLIFQ